MKKFSKDPLCIIGGYTVIALHIFGVVGVIWLVKFSIMLLINY